jgi:uncharacterized protein YqgC (DUF456 family)
MLDWFLLILALVLILIGLIGCILPIIPGPPLSYSGLLLLHFTKFGDFNFTFLIIMASVAIIVTILDYIVPIWGTKRFGGSKAGIWGATIGLVLGIFVLPPIGIIIGPLVGAIIAETLRGKDFNKSLRAGFGSLIGFALGIGLKLATSGVMTWYFFKELFSK